MPPGRSPASHALFNISNTGNIHLVLKKAIHASNLNAFDAALKSANAAQLKHTFMLKRPGAFNRNPGNNVRGFYSRDVNWSTLDKASGRKVTHIYVNILQYAAILGRRSMVEHIAEKCPSLVKAKTRDYSLLSTTIASSSDSGMNLYKVFEYLVKKGAPVNDTLRFVVAAGRSCNIIIKCIHLLISKGADVNECDNQYKATPIFFATDPEVIGTLVSKGASVCVKDVYGWTPIMTVLAGCYTNNTADPIEIIQCAKMFLDTGINVKLTGSSRSPRKSEKKISLLHIASASACVLGSFQGFHSLYRRIAGGFSTKNHRTSLQNTPLLYTLKFVKNATGDWSDFLDQRVTSRTYRTYGVKIPSKTECVIKALYFLEYGNADTSLRDADGKTASDILHSIRDLNTNEIYRIFPSLAPRQTTMLNVRLPNNLNFTDPITMNNVQLNNAYILTTDLHGKRNAKTNRNIREIKTVYNKSTLNQLINSTLRRGARLVSPITRKPFTPHNIVKLVEIVHANELSRFRNARRGTPSNNNSRRNS